MTASHPSARPAGRVLLLPLALLVVTLSGCVTAGPRHPSDAAPRASSWTAPQEAPPRPEAAGEPAPPRDAAPEEPVRMVPRALDVEAELREAEFRWHGTPHRLGGTGPQGIDCSGFVMMLYQDLFDVTLPRTTSEQVEAGEPIVPEDLRPGDLVFFRLPRTRHVGVYLSNNEFAHASSSRGVMISRLDDPYWQKGYWTTRRILNEPPEYLVEEALVEEREPEEVPVRTAENETEPLRSGW